MPLSFWLLLLVAKVREDSRQAAITGISAPSVRHEVPTCDIFDH